MALLMLEKIVILTVKKEIGSEYALYVIGGLFMIFHLMAICI